MNYLIVLRGTIGQGKSSTLNLLRQRLENDSSYRIIKSEPHPDGYDWTAIVEGPFGKVGVITFGDPSAEEHVDGILREMLSTGVEIIFAASRTRGGVWNTLQEFANNNDYTIIATAPLQCEDTNNDALVEALNASEATMFAHLIENLSKF